MGPFLGQIVTVAFNVIPTGWLPCDGRSLQIAENTALFELLGTRYGGDGVKTFKLPLLIVAPLGSTDHLFYLIATSGIYPST